VTLVLSDDDVQRAFDWGLAIDALRTAYAGAADDGRYPSRTVARGGVNWLRTLSGIPADGSPMGAKIIAGAFARRQVSYLIPLFDQDTAELVALMDGNSITGYRTAATSALAADLLARAGALSVAVIGSGFEARKHVRALNAVRDLQTVRVFSPRAESRARFAAELADLPGRIEPAAAPAEAVAGADVVICAARPYHETPALLGDWLAPGMTVVSIGSTVPEQREVDSAAIARADVIIADVLHEVLHETGDLLAAAADGIDTAAKTASLADLAAGRHPGRTGDGQIVVYKSVGAGIQDLAVASMVAGQAGKLGLGADLPIPVRPVAK
jgi:ornithine cyclodeaminase/alanine dehydrogenase